MRKTLLGIVAAATLTVPLLGAFAPANAADGENIIVNGDFENVAPDGSLVGATTDFALAQIGVQGFEYADPGDPLTSWDEGTYVVAQNPFSQHVLWADQPDTNHRMIVNGFEADTDQTVWSQSNPGIVCDVGDQVKYDFSAKVANILPLDRFNNGGANITVWINGAQVAAVDLTDNDPNNVVTLSGNVVPAADPVVLTIKNGSGVKIGNDFSLDDISLIQRGGCLTPTIATFDIKPTAPTCSAAGGLSGNPVFPIDRAGYTLSIDPAFTGAGTYKITATAKAGYVIDGPTFAEVVVQPRLTGAECAPPSIGGRTIGFWTNKNGTLAEGGKLWPSVASTYPKVVQNLTFAQAQVYIKGASSSGDGVSMMRAQFFATALNVNYISGYGAQHVSVPANVATLLGVGQCSTVTDVLSAVNAKYATIITTKASVTSVTALLDRINQDIPLAPQQCV